MNGKLAVLALAVAVALLAANGRAEDAPDAANDPVRLEEALAEKRALLRRHEDEERPRAARALLAAADAAERLGRADEAQELYGRVAALFPERRIDRDEADQRARALKEGGGALLEALLARADAARGAARLRRAKAVKVEGAILASGRRIPFSVVAARSPLRVRQDSPDLHYATGWNGQVGWRRSKSEGVVQLQGPPLDDLVRWAEGTLRDLAGGSAGTPRASGPTTVEGRLAHRVEWKNAGGDAWQVDLARDDALPARATGYALGLDGAAAAMTLYYRDWREVDGARFAGKVEYWKGAERLYTFVYEKVTLDPALEPKLFDLPD